MKWIDRKFEFDTPASIYVEQINRLKNAPNILEEIVAGIPDNILTKKPEAGWTIKENAGHLVTVDNLFIGRLDDYEKGLEELRPADMTNEATEKMDYSTLDIKEIIAAFRKKRDNFIARLEKHNAEFFSTNAWHPRLEKPMRVCDMLFFQAEHDEHHLNKIRELITSSNTADNSN
jgi:uncharacterized damage-inducible protein DinB